MIFPTISAISLHLGHKACIALSIMNRSITRNVSQVASLFLRLGLTAFGGPAAHIAMMHDEVVKRRKWLSDQEFLDLVGATNLIPGPNSTEMAIHIGFLRAGWPGLIVGGACFIVPAMLIVLALVWAYVRLGTTPEAGWLLYGIKPVVIAIIGQALWSLGRKAVKDFQMAIVGLLVVALYFLGINEILLLFAAGLAVMLAANFRRLRGRAMGFFLVPFAGAGLLPQAPAPFSLPLLFLTFLKIGSVLYGSGYVLLAFLRADFVVRLGWLTDQQLLDAIAIGQVTPGPVFTTATFLGFILGGTSGPAGHAWHFFAVFHLRRCFQPTDSPDAQVGVGRQSPGWRQCGFARADGGREAGSWGAPR